MVTITIIVLVTITDESDLRDTKREDVGQTLTISFGLIQNFHRFRSTTF